MSFKKALTEYGKLLATELLREVGSQIRGDEVPCSKCGHLRHEHCGCGKHCLKFHVSVAQALHKGVNQYCDCSGFAK